MKAGEQKDARAEPGNHFHVVFDQQHCDPQFVDGVDAVDDQIQKGGIDPGSGLIKQNDLWLGHQHASELQQFTLSTGEHRSWLVLEMRERNEIENVAGLNGIGSFLSRHLAWRGQGREQAFPALILCCGHDVFEHCHAWKWSGDLECASKPGLNAGFGSGPGQVLACKLNATGIDWQSASEKIEQRGFACAVRPDHAEDFGS